MIRAVLFDLDGTLADTARDLGWALNALLAEHGLPPQPYEAMRPIASHGARGLIRLGFGLDRDDSRFEGLRQRFLDLYDTHYADDTVLFDGVPELIDGLARAGYGWGIVKQHGVVGVMGVVQIQKALAQALKAAAATAV
jgi:phosphoglycolate phosphatase